MIKPDDLDREVFDYLRQSDADAGPIIDLVSLNHEIYTSLHAGDITPEYIRRLESKHVSAPPFYSGVDQHVAGSGSGNRDLKSQILSLARIHMHWFDLCLPRTKPGCRANACKC